MIHIEEIEIEEFRGIRSLSIKFNRKNFAICGPNGTGKSGIVDALEFALTGNISRLSGKGTGEVSVKDHAPHVDSRNRPDRARVKLSVYLPSLRKSATIERTVKDVGSPSISPDEPAIRSLFHQASLHPEFTLSRRELIKYVLSTPGDRAKEVQILLRLDDVEQLRGILQRIANAEDRAVRNFDGELKRVAAQLRTALNITELKKDKALEAVNLKRKLLELAPVTDLTLPGALKDGLVTSSAATAQTRLPKKVAIDEINGLASLLDEIQGETAKTVSASLRVRLEKLRGDQTLVEATKRHSLLTTALQLSLEECPVCDTAWDANELTQRIQLKLKALESIAKERKGLEEELEPSVATLQAISSSLLSVGRYGSLLKPAVDTKVFQTVRQEIDVATRAIETFIPISGVIGGLDLLNNLPSRISDALTAIRTGVHALPEPSQQDAARDYLTVGQTHLDTYRGTGLRLKRAKEKASVARTIYETYGSVTTDALNGIYNDVQEEFSKLYRLVNSDDEQSFSAQLTPSLGKLGFDVDFYGRGHFPPGAYHSEGHQDAMGLCLYLALMKHLQGKAFSFAVLDDVLMSVDTGHRREVCALLKQQFPDTQFVLTTHDRIWLQHMRTAGLIGSGGSIHFKTWNVNHGPTEWEDRDVWGEIEALVERNDVRAAAGELRHYLEFFGAEVCHRLRVPVEFRADAQFQLGDLLPPAIGAFRKLLKQAKAAAQAWKQDSKGIDTLEKLFSERATQSHVENWQINQAIHYNAWENMVKTDFSPVVEAFRSLVEVFRCTADGCQSLLYVTPERGPRESLRCSCGTVNLNLRSKK